LEQLSDGDMSLDHLKKNCDGSMIAGRLRDVLLFRQTSGIPGKVEFRAQNVGNVRDQERFTTHVESRSFETRLLERGFDPAEIS